MTKSRAGSKHRKPAADTVEAAETKRTKFVQARVPVELYNRIERCAEAEMISVAAYVRRALHNVVPGG